jgi:hypothetical protein
VAYNRQMKRRLFLVTAIVVLAIGGYGVYSALGSSGPVVPNVFSRDLGGGDLAQSYAALRSVGLGVQVSFINKSTLDVASDSPPRVEYMSPAPGKHFRPGDVVTLVVGTPGLAESNVFLKSKPQYRVPNFYGWSAARAIRWAGKRNLYWRIPKLSPLVASPAHKLYAAYVVTAQDPKPGTIMRQWHRTSAGGYDATWLTLTVALR